MTNILDVDFQPSTNDVYTRNQICKDFLDENPTNVNGIEQNRARIIDENGHKFLRITYQAGEFGPRNGGVQFKSCLPFHEAKEGRSKLYYEELYLQYRVRFSPNFDFMLGGKLPGFIGGSDPTGCNPKPDGFSARNMWRKSGQIVQYVYHPLQQERCGEDIPYKLSGANPYFVRGQWHTIRHHIKMNTPGFEDGILRAWFDTELVLDERQRVWRTKAFPDYGIERFYFSTFFGGKGIQWAPIESQVADFDYFVINTDSAEIDKKYGML